MAIKELGHIVFYVRDLDKSAHFYRDILEWKQITPPDAAMPVAAFSSGRTHHELLLIEVGPDAAAIPSGRRVGLYHFGLKVGDSDEELRVVLDKLEQAEVPIVGMSDHTVSHSIYIKDPDGNEIELYADVPGVNWQEHPELLLSPIKPLNI